MPTSDTIEVVHLDTAPVVSLSKEDARKMWFTEMRGSIMVVAVLVASVTYTTGLSPPGGLWQDDVNGHKASSSILHDRFPDRYTTFFYANVTAFMASLVIIILLMNENIYVDWSKVIVLYITMVLDLVSMMIAYAAGCARRLSTSFYVIVLAVGVLLFVLNTAHFMPSIWSFAKQHCPFLEKIAGKDFIPPATQNQLEEGIVTIAGSDSIPSTPNSVGGRRET